MADNIAVANISKETVAVSKGFESLEISNTLKLDKNP